MSSDSRPVAIVSGATGGIGSVICQQLAESGFLVAGITRPRPDRKPEWPLYAVNMLDVNDIESAVSDIHQGFMDRCSLLVIAHGHDPIIADSASLAPASMHQVFEADVLGAFLLAQTVGAHMIRQQYGCIVFLSSLHARQTYPARVPYAAAKAAVCGMMRSLALEWGPRGVRCNAILPWQVEGPRTQHFIDAAAQGGTDLRAAYLRRSPMGKLVTPEDIAQTVLWLWRAPSVTGQEIVLDCGVSASMWHEDFGAK